MIISEANHKRPLSIKVGAFLVGGDILNLKKIGIACQRFRKRSLKLTQSEFGKMIGYSDKTISAFERGRVNNAKLLCSYIELGFDIRSVSYGKIKSDDWIKNL